jgi:hypothetical protein
VSLALTHGVRSGTPAGGQDPFVLVQKDTGERELARFVAWRPEQREPMFQKAIDFVQSQQPPIVAFALVFEAETKVHGQARRGVAVHAGERGQGRGVLFFRPYGSPPEGTGENETVFLGQPPQLLGSGATPGAAADGPGE